MPNPSLLNSSSPLPYIGRCCLSGLEMLTNTKDSKEKNYSELKCLTTTFLFYKPNKKKKEKKDIFDQLIKIPTQKKKKKIN